MIRDLIEYMACPVCLEGSMKLSLQNTFESYEQDFDLMDIDKIEDGIIGQYWVFYCSKCGALQKLDFRGIEKMVRKEISRRILTLKARDELGKALNLKIKYFIYCGVCNGYDSNGSCPQKVYDECQLRRMPSGL